MGLFKKLKQALNPAKTTFDAGVKAGILQKPSIDWKNPLDPGNIVADKYDLGTMINKKLGINSAGTQDAEDAGDGPGSPAPSILGDQKRRKAGLSAAGSPYGPLKTEKRRRLGG